MFTGLAILGMILGGKQLAKEKFEKEIPASYWNNKDLIRKDKRSGISHDKFMKNLEKGKYYAKEEISEKYEEPSVVIKDKRRYNADLLKYGKEVVGKNAKLGMYSFIITEEEEKYFLEKKKEKEEKRKRLYNNV